MRVYETRCKEEKTLTVCITRGSICDGPYIVGETIKVGMGAGVTECRVVMGFRLYMIEVLSINF